jgi:mono/diheme cytochrome c family protein
VTAARNFPKTGRPVPRLKKRIILAGAALLALALALARWIPGWYWSVRTENPIRSGAELAVREGCFSCHMPSGRSEHANPRSRWGTVPSFFRGNLMMYVDNAGQVENFIRYGRPTPPKTTAPAGKDGAGTKGNDSKPPPLYHMPAFGKKLSAKEIRHLAAFVIAADGYLVPTQGPVSHGFELSRKYGCESCHGIAGSGGQPNPKSFTMTVPGWLGPVFPHLVHNRDEFNQWVKEGRSKRFEGNRAASFFLNRANLYMPAFGHDLSKNDVDDLWAYIQWLRSQYMPADTTSG